MCVAGMWDFLDYVYFIGNMPAAGDHACKASLWA